MEGMASNFNSQQSLVMVPQGKGEKDKLTFTDLVKATNNFGKENIIGCGGYGLVYKAQLPNGSKAAIKKLSDEIVLMDREFSAEVDALSMAPHDNVVPLWGYCIQGNSRFLIYSYMENGSLDDWLHNRDDDASSFLDWPRRLKIAQGASRGLSYMYSFGVVLLELLTGQQPIPISFVSKELVQWVWDMRAEGKQIEVLDPALRGTGYEGQMLMVLEAACQCVNRNPSMRPTIQEVVSCLDSIDANLRMQDVSVNIE
jgi:serine/threonine protein kinase